MARLKTIKTKDFPYHVYNRTNDRDFYPIPLIELWGIYVKQLLAIHYIYGARIHAFVLMGNHFHLLISTPEENISEIMNFLQSCVSREVKQKTGLKRYRFTARYRWRLVQDSSYYKTVYRYIAQNPLKEGLCADPVLYPWSSFSGKYGVKHLEFPICHHDWLGGELHDWDWELAFIQTPVSPASIEELENNLWRRATRARASKKGSGKSTEVAGTWDEVAGTSEKVPG